jgi:dolichol-phosphate mannosyltransferase
MKKVSIVICFYNESESIESLFIELRRVEIKLKNIVEFEYICVNDGSNDMTLDLLKKARTEFKNIKIYNLYRNFGHEIAMTAGMDVSNGDSVIFMDADLQHPPYLVEKMVLKWLKGSQVVLTRKISKDSDKNILYLLVSRVYYAILNRLSDIHIPNDQPDFRLLDRKYVDKLKQMKESNRMFRALIYFIGLKNPEIIDFTVPRRKLGKTKYNFSRSFVLAMDGIMQYSVKPLRVVSILGVFSVVLSGILGLFTLYQYLFLNIERSGYATILLIVVFMGSIQLIMLGIVGEYIGKIHLESKKRPLYFGEMIE